VQVGLAGAEDEAAGADEPPLAAAVELAEVPLPPELEHAVNTTAVATRLAIRPKV
jgi:hypothetical protein